MGRTALITGRIRGIGAARGITVSAIAPRYTDTAMVRAVAPNIVDIARGVLFLVADEASFITGTTLSINGGKYLE